MNNKIFVFLLMFVVWAAVVIFLLFIVNKKPVKQQNQQVIPIEGQFTEIPDIITVIDCMDCNGTGIFEYNLFDPMVTHGLVPEGTTETCQSCKGLGKMRKCERPNGMVYYMSLEEIASN